MRYPYWIIDTAGGVATGTEPERPSSVVIPWVESWGQIRSLLAGRGSHRHLIRSRYQNLRPKTTNRPLLAQLFLPLFKCGEQDLFRAVFVRAKG